MAYSPIPAFSTQNSPSMTSPSLNDHTIPTLPPTFTYIPSFLTSSQERDLLNQINARPWISLSKRRLQVYPAQLTANNVLLSKDPLPDWLTELKARLDELGCFDGAGKDGEKAEMNHVLINNYRPGEGIMPHEDGPAYYPVTATVSLGSHTVLDVAEKGEDSRRWRILQEPRSLLVTRGEAYGELMHGIAEVEVDEELGEGSVANWETVEEKALYEGRKERAERVSLTCRSVKRVSKLGSKLMGKR